MTFYLAYSDILSGIPSHVHPLHALHPLHPGLPGHIYIYLSLYLLYPGLCGQGPAGLRGQGAGAAW